MKNNIIILLGLFCSFIKPMEEPLETLFGLDSWISQQTTEEIDPIVFTQEYINKASENLLVDYIPESQNQNVENAIQNQKKRKRDLSKNPFKCCDKVYSPSGFSRHMKKHRGEKYKCMIDHCIKEYVDKRDFDDHVKAVHKHEKYTCDQCGKEFIAKRNFEEHIKRPHLVGPDKNNKVLQKYRIKKHSFFISQNRDKKKHKCEYENCNQEYVAKRDLDNHIRAIHKGEKYKCDSCNKEYQSQGNLAQHIQMIHLNKKIECGGCNKKFNHKQDLNDHIKVVHNGELYKCDPCNKEYFSKRGFNMHMKKKHPVIA